MKKFASAAGLTLFALAAAYALPQPVFAPMEPACPVSNAKHCDTGVRVLFVGDIMLDRNVARTAESEGAGALFSTSTRALFADADVRVANLEGTVTGNPSIARQNNKILRFTFNPALAKEVLQGLHIDAVSLANNHALDFGEFGYDETRDRVENTIGTKVFGHPLNDKGTLSTAVVSKGKTLCFVGYHALFDADIAPVVSDIQALHPECWRVIVFAHWGEEYKTRSNAAQREAARAFIDAGADLVIGAHPHVVQEHEVYKNKAIFYSLGNCMFDQNFSWGTTHSLEVRADFYTEKTDFTLTPLTVIEQHSAVADGQVAEFTLP